jgi:hypothetical protein
LIATVVAPGGRPVVAASEGERPQLLVHEGGRALLVDPDGARRELPGVPSPFTTAALSPAGDQLAYDQEGGAVLYRCQRARVAGAVAQRCTRLENFAPRALAFSGQGVLWLAGAGAACWPPLAETPIGFPAAPAALLAAHPQSETVALVGEDGTVTVARGCPATLAAAGTVAAHPRTAAWHPARPVLAVGTTEGVLQLLDTESRRVIADVRLPAPVEQVRFARGGDELWIVAQGRVLRWDLNPATLRARTCEPVPAELSAVQWVRRFGAVAPRAACHASGPPG